MNLDLLQLFAGTIQSHQMIEPRDKILVAVSGGPDSMALLHLFHRWQKVPFGVFHLNHQFRKEAVLESEFVKNMADKFGVVSHIYTYNVEDYLDDTGVSKQTGARQIRHKLINECMVKHGYTKVAFGHHLDDQAETVLMRLLRGTGLAGLGGIQYIRQDYLRPLLDVPKNELISYCSQFSVPYYQDQSNFDTRDFRNKVRIDLLPLIEEEYNPQFSKQLWRLAQIAQGDEAELAEQTSRLFKQLAHWEDDLLYLDREKFNQLSIAFQRRLLQKSFLEKTKSYQRTEFEQIEKVRDLCLGPRGFSYQLPQVMVSGTAKYIILGTPESSTWEAGILPVPGEIVLGSYRIITELVEGTGNMCQVQESGGTVEYFALDQLKKPLIYRRRKPGDRIHLFGQASAKKVKDVLIDAKVPFHLRDEIPIICDQQEIILISGIRRSEKGRITEGTRDLLRVIIDK